MDILSRVAEGMQEVLTESADIIGRKTGFIKRFRKLSGSGFAQTLVFSWLSNPDSTVEELCQTAATLGISISPHGLNKRFSPEASDFFQKILESAVSHVISDDPVFIPLLQRFNGVHIHDSSTVVLPDKLAVIWAGCGGSTSQNTSSSLKLHLRLDLNTGKLAGPYLHSGKLHDMNSQIPWERLPVGALRIGDLGYYNLKEFRKMCSEGVYWLSRVKSNCVLYYHGKRWDLPGFLMKYCKDRMDVQVLLGADERLPCRFLAIRVSDDVARLRRCKLISEAKAKGKPIRDKTLKLASWIVLVCNIPHEMLSLDEAFVLMRTRWQIELIFKLWKSHGCIDEWRTENPWRILCEVYAKLLVMLIQHWILLAGCWQYPNRSLFKAVKTIQKHAMNLACAFASGHAGRLYEALETIQRCLSVGCRINKRRKDPSTYQLLLALDDGGLS
jgi:hypothetical protein